MNHIFISYSKTDVAFARHLRQLLIEAGFGVWMDEKQLAPHEQWWPTIERNIETCAALIVIMSPESRVSRWVQREILYAEKLARPVFPVLLAGDIWPMLAETQYEDMRAGVKAPLSARLVRALTGVIPANLTPTIPPQLPVTPRRARSRRPLWMFAAALSLLMLVGALVLVVALYEIFGNTNDHPTATRPPGLTLSPSEATREAILATLTSSFKSSLGLTVRYPDGWVGDENTYEQYVTVANLPEALDTGTPDNPMQPGQVVLEAAAIPKSSMLDVGENLSPFDVLVSLSDSLRNGPVGEITHLVLGGRPAARINYAESQAAKEGFFVAVEGDENTFIVIGGRAYTGYLAANEALLLEMAAQVIYTPPTP
jgi:hypothetical protein